MTNPKKIEVYTCSDCASVYFVKIAAEKCCQHKTCATENCNNKPERDRVLCEDCIDKKSAEKRNQRIEEAKTDSHYHGPCFDYEGNFYHDAESWEDQQEEACGEWLFVAKKVLVFEKMEAMSLIEQFLEYANVEDINMLLPIAGCDELLEAVEKFKKTNESVCYYKQDFAEKFWAESE